jgi:hypothetical protein
MPYYEKTYLLPQDKTTEYIILAIALFLIILVWTAILYRSTNYQAGDVKALLTCKAGECPTNRFTGEKRCSKNTVLPLQYDPIYEVCNPPNSCTAFETPYAVQSNGSTNFNGQCDVSGCSCITELYTPSFVEVLFNAQNGTLLSNNPNTQSKLTLTQQPNPYVGEGNNVPIQYTDPSSQFWEVSPGYLSYITPNVCGDLYGDNPTVGNQITLACINRNPCIVGRMAYLPTDSTAFNDFTASNIDTTNLACVPNSVENPQTTNSCQTTTGNFFAPVFDLTTGKIYCFDTGIPVL